MEIRVSPAPTPAELAAIAAAVEAALAAGAAPPAPAAGADAGYGPREAFPVEPWRAAARIESLGIVRRIPGRLDLRYMGAPTKERLARPH